MADHLCAPIPRLPAAGELLLTSELPLAIGGCAANTAIDLVRLGVATEVVGSVGDDPLGRFVVETLRAADVGTAAIRTDPAQGTSGTLIINVEGEDRRYIHMTGANDRLRAEHIPLDLVRAARVLYVGGYLLMAQLDPHELAEVFREARRANVVTVLDVVLPGPGEHGPRLAPVLKQTDLFLPNRDEAAAITGLDDPRAQAARFLESGARTVVITGGDEGTILVSDELRLRAGTFSVPFVGGTGAGDAFDAGYIAGLLAGLDSRGCLEWGSALGASCVRSVSATQSCFTRRELDDFLRQHKLEVESF